MVGDQLNRVNEDLRNQKVVDATNRMSREISNQNNTLIHMMKAVGELVKSQKESNNIMFKQYQELKVQNDLLIEDNKSQEKQLRLSRVFGVVSWSITTLIAITSVVFSIIK